MAQDVKDLAAAAKAAAARIVRHTFKFPDSARELESDPKTVTIRQLTFEEEQQAVVAAKTKGVAFVQEGAIRSIVAFDGNPVTWDDNGKENAFASLSNKVRDLVIQAFTRIAIPSQKEAEDFFDSEKPETP